MEKNYEQRINQCISKVMEIKKKRFNCFQGRSQIIADSPKILTSKKTSMDYGLFVPDTDIDYIMPKRTGVLLKQGKNPEFTYYFDKQERIALTESRYVRKKPTKYLFYFYEDNFVEILSLSMQEIDAGFNKVCYWEYIDDKTKRYVETMFISALSPDPITCYEYLLSFKESEVEINELHYYSQPFEGFSEKHYTKPIIKLHEDLELIYPFVRGDEADKFIVDNVINVTDQRLSKDKKTEIYKKLIDEVFYLGDGKNYPSWIQGGEYPIINGKPAKFIEQITKGEKVEYIFEDVDTHEQVIVEQFY